MTKKKKKSKKNKVTSKRENKDISKKEYKGILGYLLKLIDEKESRQSKILGWILNVFIITSLFTGAGYLYNKYQDRELIKQKIEVADNYFTTEQYKKALDEYKSLINTFNKSEHKEYYQDLITKIGETLIYVNSNSSLRIKQLEESILYLSSSIDIFEIYSDKYNYNILQINIAQLELFEITQNEKYLKTFLQQISLVKTENIIITGLKNFFLNRYYQKKGDLKLAKMEVQNALKIFTKDNCEPLNSSLNIDFGSILMDEYHNSKNKNTLEQSKTKFDIAFNNSDDKVTKAISEFGIAHYLFHSFELDSLPNNLYDSEKLFQKTLFTYNNKDHINHYHSSNFMLAQVKRELYELTNDIIYLNDAKIIIENSLDYYKPDFYINEYYTAKYILASINYTLKTNNSKQLESIINLFNESLEYYTLDRNPDIHSQILAMKADCYYFLSEINNSNYHREQANLLLFHSKKPLMTEYNDNDYYNIGLKYYKTNNAYYNYTKDSSALHRAQQYKMLISDSQETFESGKELLSIMEKLRGVFEIGEKYSFQREYLYKNSDSNQIGKWNLYNYKGKIFDHSKKRKISYQLAMEIANNNEIVKPHTTEISADSLKWRILNWKVVKFDSIKNISEELGKGIIINRTNGEIEKIQLTRTYVNK